MKKHVSTMIAVTLLGLAGASSLRAETPPAVAEIFPVDVSPVYPGLVIYGVLFTQAVTGVDADDFLILTTGLTGADLSQVFASPQSGSLVLSNPMQYARSTERAAFQVSRDLTIEAWIYPQAQTPYAGIVSNLYDSGLTESGYAMLLDGVSGIYFVVTGSGTGAQYLSSGPNTIKLNQWQHVACVYNGTDMDIYVEGVRVVSSNIAVSPAIDYLPANDFLIGKFEDDNENVTYSGMIADVRVWSVARTLEEVINDRVFPLVGSEEGLIGYWTFNELEDLVIPSDGVDDVRDFATNDGAQHLDLAGAATLGGGPELIYGIQVRTGTLDSHTPGTLGLGLSDNDTIVNGDGIPLGGAGLENGSFFPGVESDLTVIIGRELGDFDGTGCTDVQDFLYLIDNWQMLTDLGPPVLGVPDFLGLLDTWQTGELCA